MTTTKDTSRFSGLDFDDNPKDSPLVESPESIAPLLEIDGVDGVYNDSALVSGAVEDGGPALQALRRAGLDFPVGLVQPYVPELPQCDNIGDFRYCARLATSDHPGHVFGAVSPNYGFVSPAELAATFDAAIPSNAEVSMWSHDSGAHMWINVNLGVGAYLDPHTGSPTELQFRLQGHHAYGGKGSLNLAISVFIMICSNGMVIPLTNDSGKVIKIRHTVNFEERVSTLRKAFSQAESSAAGLATLLKQMEGVEINAEQFDAFAEKLFPEKSPQAKNNRDRLHVLYNHAAGAAPGTAWGALQAATNYATHEFDVRTGGRNARRYSLDMPQDVEALARQRSLASGPAGVFTHQAYKYVSTMMGN